MGINQQCTAVLGKQGHLHFQEAKDYDHRLNCLSWIYRHLGTDQTTLWSKTRWSKTAGCYWSLVRQYHIWQGSSYQSCYLSVFSLIFFLQFQALFLRGWSFALKSLQARSDCNEFLRGTCFAIKRKRWRVDHGNLWPTIVELQIRPLKVLALSFSRAYSPSDHLASWP